MDTRALLIDTADRMFRDHCDKALLDKAEAGEFPSGLLKVVRDNGFHQLAMVNSEVALADALAVLKVAGRHALPLPLAELLLGHRWLNQDTTMISVGRGDAGGAHAVPWGRQADLVVAIGSSGAFLHREFSVVQGTNLAGEPRDEVRSTRSEPLSIGDDAWSLLALCRVQLMAGGLERALELSLQYVSEREQFGRPIARFQAIQHHMAVMAAEVAAGIRAADAALAGIGGERCIEEIAAAKIRVGEAVGVVVELAQQVHGAMGYTHEHRLHHTTRRLWSWRDEYGNERYWQQFLGRQLARRVAAGGPDRLWEFIATRG